MKELRLAGISTVEEANRFAPYFMEAFNQRFARPARNPHNAHRPLRDDENLQEIFTWQETRKVSSTLTLHYKRLMYVLDKTDAARNAMNQRVSIYETEDGEVSIRHQGVELPARVFAKEGYTQQGVVVEHKLLDAALSYAKKMQDEREQQRL